MVGPRALNSVGVRSNRTSSATPFTYRLMVGQQFLKLRIQVRFLRREPTQYWGFVQWQDNGL